MAKITNLDPLATEDVDGTETMPVVKGGVTRRTAAAPFVDKLAGPYVALSEAAAALTAFASQAEGEAATAEGQGFAVSTVTPGIVEVYLRTASGSDFVRTVLSGEALAAEQGAGRIGYVGRTVEAKLKESLSVCDKGAVSGDTAGNLLAAFQAAIDELPSIGGTVVVPDGDYSNLVADSLSVGSKAVSWRRDGAIVLPAGMPGVVLTSGTVSLPESSVQSNRTVRVHDYRKMGNIAATASTRQYAIHIEGYLEHVPGSPAELEARAYSFDLVSNQGSIVDVVRGMKGRVAGNGGDGNYRAIYGFAESIDGSDHDGSLTGVIGTAYKNSGNSNTNGDSFGVRGHADAGCTGMFQAAGAKAGEECTVFFAYSVRTGTGQPAKPTVAQYQAHGGGTGHMFAGYVSNTDLTFAFIVDRLARMLVKSACSGAVTLANDTVWSFTPPNPTGNMDVWVELTAQASGDFNYRANASPLCTPRTTVLSAISFQTGIPTGATGPVDKMNVFVGSDGKIYFENRLGAAKTISFFNKSRNG
ncbi:hypothetical protein [Novosphingobium sp. KN65.2]|uniref:hypothetical protein n=1 Tax=Novosphingobium sp. KN65.2 TaxID=1478134 RepID=UPI0005E670C7|nr:hypothetical protein [Novosphingobium sp. KN65.2]CDO35825.1 hypothetical protein SPHV1_2270171 [Novosphingobium sp. KN65.2]